MHSLSVTSQVCLLSPREANTLDGNRVEEDKPLSSDNDHLLELSCSSSSFDEESFECQNTGGNVD